MADFLSRGNKILGSEWTLLQDVVEELQKRWLVVIDIFATTCNRRLPTYLSPVNDPVSQGIDAILQFWDNLQVYAISLSALIRQVLDRLWMTSGVEWTIIAPFWKQKKWFPDRLDLLIDPPVILTGLPSVSSEPFCGSTSYVETIEQLMDHLGFSRGVAH